MEKADPPPDPVHRAIKLHDFRLALDVPVVWLIDLSRSSFHADVLPAGAVLDRAPVPVTSEIDTPQQAFAIRIHGLEGFVSASRLKEALPDWDPGKQVPSEEHMKPEANDTPTPSQSTAQLYEERESGRSENTGPAGESSLM